MFTNFAYAFTYEMGFICEVGACLVIQLCLHLRSQYKQLRACQLLCAKLAI